MGLPYTEEEYYERFTDCYATPAQADREYAFNVGRQNPDHPWILSDRDAWYRNPFYICQAGQPYPNHPEDY